MFSRVRLLVYLVISIALVAPLVDSRNIKVSLRTNWPGIPLHLQASEYFAEESNELFWRFVEAMPALDSSATDKSVYDKILEIATSFELPDAKLALLKTALSIDYYNPRVQGFQQIIANFIAEFVTDESKRAAVNVTSPSFTCPDFVYINGDIVCDANKITNIDIKPENKRPVLYSFDHVYPDSADDAPVAILHSSIGSPNFKAFHEALSSLAKQGKVTYVYRHFVTQKLEPTLLQGYGVELALKNIEYKVMDDRKEEGGSTEEAATQETAEDDSNVQGFIFSTLMKRYPEHASELLALKAQLIDSTDEAFEKLKVWDLKEIGLRAAQQIVNAHDPLRMLQDISQNLPTMAPILVRQTCSDELRKALQESSELIETGMNALLINGRLVDMEHLEPFSLYNPFRDEVEKYLALKDLNFSRTDVFNLLALPMENRVDIRINLNSETIDWINNLESDSTYSRWPKSVKAFLYPVFPGQLHYVAKNAFSIVAVIDPTNERSIEIATNLIALTYRNNAPFRVGFLMLTHTAEDGDEVHPSVAFVRAWKYCYSKYGARRAVQFLQQVFMHGAVTSLNTVKQGFTKVASANEWQTAMSEAFQEKVEDMRRFLRDVRIRTPSVFMNGIKVEVSNANMLAASLLQELGAQKPQLVQYIADEIINDQTDIYSTILELDSFPYYSDMVIPSGDKREILASLHTATAKVALDTISYFTVPKTHNYIKPVSQLLVVDLSTTKGRNLAISGFERIFNQGPTTPADEVRLALVNCEPPRKADTFSTLIKAYNALGRVSSTTPYLSAQATNLFFSLLEKSNTKETAFTLDEIIDFIKTEDKDNAINIEAFKAVFNSEELNERLKQQHAFCVEVKKSLDTKTSTFVITNGRVSASEESDITSTELFMLEKYSKLARTTRIVDYLLNADFVGVDKAQISRATMSDIIQKVVAVLSRGSRLEGQLARIPPELQPTLVINSAISESPITISAIIDPLSTAAQRVAPTLIFLRDVFDADIKLYLNPRHKHSGLPLKSFYRFLFNPIDFDESGKRLTIDRVATFSVVPQKRVLSMNIHPPSSWLVGAVQCKYDLDNILLADLPANENSLTAVFELENILIEGSCSDDSNSGVPPRGLQINLGDYINPHKVDTLVMSNLGYYQLKANPGVWDLRLGDGRHSEIYRIVGGNRSIAVMDFVGSTELLHVEKQPGKKNEPLFKVEDEESNAGIWASLSNLFDKKGTSKNETIHVFSLASGHLYERFLKIMMLSVVKNTNNPVKFWFLKNFLSPKFKEFVPKMAKMYNFEVEFVTYKWPAWLYPQTEKQRIIWGYKILFLDVLFPLGLKKVIYVDADQVVRADLKELWDMDLRGAPYGYTPFCSGEIMREETKGFRFWDQGFWKEHLRGKPYHISALYVVDLVRFRQLAAGDRLRATYDGLARDPNSLANLDQDLPNYMQHFVRIHSLPREWLWCETWCTDESKAAAKTIDLCNNPLTKTPKLENAMRIIPEWVALDNEVKNAERIIYGNASGSPTQQQPQQQQDPSQKDEL